jgi:hypothetical protein
MKRIEKVEKRFDKRKTNGMIREVNDGRLKKSKLE